jgi:N-acetylmuramoyl-L-alanine amidase
MPNIRKAKPHPGRWGLALLAACLVGCAHGPSINWTHPSINQDSRVQFIVLHATEIDFPTSLKVLTHGTVSSHYLVDRDGTIYGLVPEGRRAWHAGSSFWEGSTPLNPSSIGIEIVSVPLGMPEGTDVPFPEPQVKAVRELVRDIAHRHHVRPDRIVGHGEIQPEGRTDPGHWFPWSQLAHEGLIPTPNPVLLTRYRSEFEKTLPDVRWLQERFAAHGYRIRCTGVLDRQTKEVIGVFQGRYRQDRVTGEPDAETGALIATLTAPDGRLLDDGAGHFSPFKPEGFVPTGCPGS